MARSILAGATYFAIVFAAAFALGVLRVTFIVSAIGALWAAMLELPFTLAASRIICGWLYHLFAIRSLGQAAGMAASAFALPMAAEAAGSILLFNRSLADHFGSYATAVGGVGLAGQIAFGLFPAVIWRRNATAISGAEIPRNETSPTTPVR
jgi:hypothetical protein